MTTKEIGGTQNTGTGNIITYTGKRVSPMDMTPDDVDPLDIAHALSNLCRYNGHVSHFYSVAQHSVLVAQRFDEGSYLRRWAILHDAPETYLGDLVAPLKYTDDYSFYREAEERLMTVIAYKFGLDPWEPPEIKAVDLKLRGAEMRDLKNYDCGEETYSFRIRPWLPQYAKDKFIQEMRKAGIDV